MTQKEMIMEILRLSYQFGLAELFWWITSILNDSVTNKKDVADMESNYMNRWACIKNYRLTTRIMFGGLAGRAALITYLAGLK